MPYWELVCHWLRGAFFVCRKNTHKYAHEFLSVIRYLDEINRTATEFDSYKTDIPSDTNRQSHSDPTVEVELLVIEFVAGAI